MSTLRWRRTAYRSADPDAQDPVTHLRAGSNFQELLVTAFKHAQRRSSILGLVFIRIPAAQVTRDREGDSAADRLLKAVADRLRNNCRQVDLLSRHEDDFCLLLTHPAPGGVESVGQRLINCLEAPFESGPTLTHSLTQDGRAKVGAVTCMPHRRLCPFDRFLAAVDWAMNQVQQSTADNLVSVSLLTDEEIALDQGVQSHKFSRYLEESGKVAHEAVRSSLDGLSSDNVLIGRWARRMGWLSAGQLRRVLGVQRQRRERFGESARKLGYLSERQVMALLAIQQENPEHLLLNLIDQGAVDSSVGQGLLQDYFRKLQRTAGSFRWRALNPLRGSGF